MRNLYRAALVLALLGGSLASHGQRAAAPPALTGTFQSVPFAEFARRVAATTPYRLYFDPAETDSLRVPLTATGQHVPEVLRLVLEPARLHFSIDADYRVYITAGESVKTQLPADFFQAPSLAQTPPVAAPSTLANQAQTAST